MKSLFSTDEEIEITEHYKLYKNKNLTIEKYKLSQYKFYKILKDYNVVLRNIRNNSEYNTESFRYFDTDQKASYFYGLILSDGNLYNGKIQFSIQESDVSILEQLKNYVNSSAKINYRESTKSYSFTFGDILVVERLVEQGLQPAKSNKEKLPKFDWINSCDFIRGLIDGDGSISLSTNGSPSVNLCGSLEVVTGFIQYVNKHISPKKLKNAKKVHSSGLHKVGYYGQEAVAILRKLYYEGCVTIPRKQASVKRIMEVANGPN